MSFPQPTGQRSGPAGGPPRRALPVEASDLLLLLIVNLGAVRLAGALVRGLIGPAARGGEAAAGDTVLAVTLALLLLQAVVVVASIRALIVRKYGLTWADLGLVASTPAWYRRALVLAVVLMPAVALVNAMLPRLAGEPFENPQIQAIAPAGFSWFALVGMVALGGIVAPIAEEIAFRGVLYPWLRARLGAPGGIVTSALCFAVLHGVVLLIPALVLIGAVLAWITERSGSIWPAVVTHAAFNTLMILALYGALASGLQPPS